MIISQNIKTIIWDFNGTLLDDTDICIQCMNVLLEERGLPKLDRDRYREIFNFPVKDYYEEAGFDFSREDFEIPAHQFIGLYKDEVRKAGLFGDVLSVLNYFREKGYRQCVLSAMQQDFLTKTISKLGIAPYFTHIYGIRDHLAAGKIEMAKELMATLGQKPEEICMIGDTIHDYQVAAELGISIMLVTRGHQSFERLQSLDCVLVHNLAGLMKIC